MSRPVEVSNRSSVVPAIPNTTSAHFPLPVELWVRIVEFRRRHRLASSTPDHEVLIKRIQLILPLLFVDKRLYQVAMPFVYETAFTQVSGVGNVHILTSRSELRRHVKVLLLDGGTPWLPSAVGFPDAVIGFPNLRTIIVRNGDVDDMFMNVVREYPELRSLKVVDCSIRGSLDDWDDSVPVNPSAAPSPLAAHLRLTEIALCPGNDRWPVREDVQFLQLLSPAVQKLTINTNLLRFLLPILEQSPVRLPHLIDLTVWINGEAELLVPFYAHFAAVESLSVMEEHNVQHWDGNVTPELLPKLKRLTGIGAYIKPFLPGRKIEYIRIEDDYTYCVEDFPEEIPLRYFNIYSISWADDYIKDLARKFPALEHIVLWMDSPIGEESPWLDSLEVSRATVFLSL